MKLKSVLSLSLCDTPFCMDLNEKIFDIEVLDNQNIPQTDLSSFKGSADGTTIANLEPGTYTVKEIKHPVI